MFIAVGDGGSVEDWVMSQSCQLRAVTTRAVDISGAVPIQREDDH